MMHVDTALPAPYRMYDGPLTTAIFDWAGTVLDFGCLAPVKAFVAAFEQHGVAISEAEARVPMGAAKREHIEQLLAMPAVQERWTRHHGAASTQADVGALYAVFLRSDAENVARYSDLIPGALEAIDALRARGIAIGSTTGYPREVMTALVPLAHAQGYRPDHLCTASDVARGRPWPDMVLANAVALRAPDVRACVVVDDSPSGLASARAAGMWAVGIAASGNEVGLSLADWSALDDTARREHLAPARERLHAAGAQFVIDSLADLLPVIDAIEQRLRAGAAA